jgi:hypothetical protein
MSRGLPTFTAFLALVSFRPSPAREVEGFRPQPQNSPSRPMKFTRDIRPILARHCYACHGPDENQRKAKLRLDIKEGAFAEHEGGRPFVPGSIEESEALRRVASDDPTEQMPPGGKEKRLAQEQVAALKQWVEQGAKELFQNNFSKTHSLAILPLWQMRQ